jgi:hypothetical protein
MKIDYQFRGGLFFCIAIIICFISGREFIKMKIPDKIYPSAGITKISNLSEYNPNLKGTNGNSAVYYFDSGKPGGTFLLLGGTHPNEPAGFISALLLAENLKVLAGKIIIIPQACYSGFTCTDPLEGCPEFYSLITKSGKREFRFGSRVSNPLDQWPDPLVYSHYPSGQELSGFETRNLNRSYPGRENGSFTEKVGFAIIELLKKEKVDIAIDLHEAAPEVQIINALICHEKGKDIAASAVLSLELENLQYALEMSPQNFRGLSHREWGDRTAVYPFLMETSNPIQGRLRSRTTAELVVSGVDKCYKEASQIGKFRITYNLDGEPLKLRVGRHIEGIKALLDAFAESFPEKKIAYENIPVYQDLMDKGVGFYLH